MIASFYIKPYRFLKEKDLYTQRVYLHDFLYIILSFYSFIVMIKEECYLFRDENLIDSTSSCQEEVNIKIIRIIIVAGDC